MSNKNNDKVQQLIEQIKKDALQKAQKEADKIIDDAKGKAKLMIENANSEAGDIKSHAEKEAQSIVKNGKSELNGIARDIVGALQGKIITLFQSGFTRSAETLLSSENYLSELFLVAKQQFTTQDIEVTGPIVLIDYLRKELSEENITLKVNENSAACFIIKTGGKEYSFTKEDVMQVVMEYCSPALQEILTRQEEV